MPDRSQFYPLIERYYPLVGLPFELGVAQVDQESDFDPNSESSSGALGLCQLMPGTFPSFTRSQLLDPETNVKLGSAFLAEQVGVWKQETQVEAIKYGLACYNGGLGYVLAAQKAAGAAGAATDQWDAIAPFLQQIEVNGRKPDWQQITGYVSIIMATWQKLQQSPIAGFGLGANQ